MILPGLWILQITKFEPQNIIERLSFSYILSLATMFSILYIGSMFKIFNVASIIFLAIVIVSFVHLSLLFVIKNWHKPHLAHFSFFSNLSKDKLIILVSTVGLLLLYAVFLSSSAILDSDVVQYYLPIAREIVKVNEFAYGYDYNIFLKPIGSSIIYAWTYIINGSMLSESFRLMPLIPMLFLIMQNYAITTLATNSKTLGIISSAIFLVLPFHDRFILYNVFYPDIFYYPLIFGAIYFLIKYSQTRQNSLLIWTGIAFGIASLLKAQTIFILIAYVVIFLVLELRNHKNLSVALCCFVPFLILVPDILTKSIQGGTFQLFIPTFTGTQWMIFLFLSILSGACCYVSIHINISRNKIDLLTIKSLVKRLSFLLIPVVLLSSLWYVNNFLRFDTVIWTSSINLPNYEWAVGILQPETVQQTLDVEYYLWYFIFMFADPALMGYVLLVPFLIGLFFILRKKIKSIGVLLLFSGTFASILLSNVVISLNSTSVYNPRDIFVLAPALTTISAVGIVSITSNFNKINGKLKTGFTSLLLVGYFGLLNYIHSVLLWFTSTFSETVIGNFVSSLGNVVGFNVAQTSFQLSSADRVVFIGDNILKIVVLALIAGIPALMLIIYRYRKIFMRRELKVGFLFRSPRLGSKVEGVLVILFLLSVITIPRIEMLNAQGGVEGIKEFQLENTFKDFYESMVKAETELDGNILTFKAPSGLQYYLPENKIIDLRYAANLAFLKDCLGVDSPYETVAQLKHEGINYMLINPSITKEFDASLNFVISKVLLNPELCSLSQSFGNWKLYSLGPYEVEKTFISLSGWSVDERYTNASYILNSSESEISLHLEATDTNSRVTIRHLDISKLNLSNYDFVITDLKGNDSTSVLMRFFLDDGTSLDLSYWRDVYTVASTPFDLSSYGERTLRGDVYFAIKSSDGIPVSLDIMQIYFMKIITNP